MSGIQHNALVDIGAKWLAHGHDGRQMGGCYVGSCGVILKEYVAGRRLEIPDVIGFASDFSIVIECKVSRADFLNERKKVHAISGIRGRLGNYRYYFTPDGLLTMADIPEGWGLLSTTGDKVSVKLPAPHLEDPGIKVAEYELLYSIIRRIEIRGLLPKVQEKLTGGER